MWDVRRRALTAGALRGDVGLARLQPRRQAARRRRVHEGPTRSATPAAAGSCAAPPRRLRALGGLSPDGACSPSATTTARRSCGRRRTGSPSGGRWTAHGTRALPRVLTRRADARDGQRRRHGRAVGRRDAAADRLAADDRPDAYVSATFSPTARTCSPCRRLARACAGTCGPRPGTATPASSPAASSRARSGATRSQSGPTRRSATFAETGIARPPTSGVRSGGGGIRTRERVAPSPVFKTGAFDHSATPPGLRNVGGGCGGGRRLARARWLVPLGGSGNGLVTLDS